MQAVNGRLSRLASFLWNSSDDEGGEKNAPLPNGTAVCSPNDDDSTQSQGLDDTVVQLQSVASCTVAGATASLNAWKFHVQKCDPKLLEYAELHDVMGRINTYPQAVFDLLLAKGKLASTVLRHCKQVIRRCAEARHRNFKIGLTSDPWHRWGNRSYGYCLDKRFVGMTIIAVLHSSEGAAFLEASLIAEFQGCSQCLNDAPGGEGAALDVCPAFVYYVYGPSVQPGQAPSAACGKRKRFEGQPLV
jgi:hypothetical protein